MEKKDSQFLLATYRLKSTYHQPHLDALRGIAALIVVFTHYIGAFLPYSAFANQGYYQQRFSFESLFFYPPFGLMIAGHFAVCLFFILSGYVLSYSYLGEARNTKKLCIAILKRPIRLGGVVLFTVMLGGALWYAGFYYNDAVADLSTSKPWFSDLWKGGFDINAFLTNISGSLFSHAEIYNKSMWTIQVELYGSMLVFLVLLFASNYKYRFILFIFLSVFFMRSFYQGFFLGMLVADLLKNKPIKLSANVRKLFELVLFSLFLYFSSYPHYASTEYLMHHTIYNFLPSDAGFEGGYPMLAAFLLFCFICLNDKVKSFLNFKVFKFLGKISYGVYGVHILVIGSFSSWMFLAVYPELGYAATFLLVLLSGLLLAIFLGYLITLYVDKPAIRLSNFAGNKIVNLIYSNFKS
jgi:peptidoglycan/LPS O-acetylase OafA/YrhL